MNRNKISTNFILAAAVFFAAAMAVFPSITESGSKSAIIIWANSIVPILLPYFIFADFIKRTVNTERLPGRVYPFIIAFLSGYPAGAKIVGDLVRGGSLTKEEGEEVLSYSLVTGPGFILGTIGAFLGSYKAALIVAIAHYAGAFCNRVFYRIPKRERSLHQHERSRSKGHGRTHAKGAFLSEGKTSPLENFTAAISSAFKSMAVILAYLIVFMIAIDLLEAFGAFRQIAGEPLRAFLKGIFEMTVGCNLIGLCDMNLSMKTALTAFIVSFGGLSVIGQSISMAAGSGIGAGKIFRIKLTHGLLAGIIAVVLSLLVVQ